MSRNLIEGYLIVAPVIEAGRAGGSMIRQLLRDFELPAVFEIFGNPGRGSVYPLCSNARN
jgi:hypothetical protein